MRCASAIMPSGGYDGETFDAIGQGHAASLTDKPAAQKKGRLDEPPWYSRLG